MNFTSGKMDSFWRSKNPVLAPILENLLLMPSCELNQTLTTSDGLIQALWFIGSAYGDLLGSLGCSFQKYSNFCIMGHISLNGSNETESCLKFNIMVSNSNSLGLGYYLDSRSSWLWVYGHIVLKQLRFQLACPY